MEPTKDPKESRAIARLRSVIGDIAPSERSAAAKVVRETLDLGGRVPPNNEEAEAAVLSAVLTSERALDACLEVLPTGEAFYGDAHRRIYDAAAELHAKGQPVDIQTVAAVLRDRDRLQAIGGIAYLAQIVDATPSVAHVAAHAKIVREKWRVRRLIDTCSMIAAEGYGDYGDAITFVTRALDLVGELVESSSESRLASLGEIGRVRDVELQERWAGKREAWGISSPHKRVHAITHGMEPGQVVFVGADTSGGKSVYAEEVGLDVAERTYGGEPCGVAYITLEMPREQVYDRGLVHLTHKIAPPKLAGVTYLELKTGCQEDPEGISKRPLEPNQIWLIERAQRKIHELPFDVDDSDHDITKVRATVRKAQARLRARGARLRLVIVDHVHIMSMPEAERLDLAIAETCRGFKRLAVELELHVMVLAQFSREATKADRPPMITDLKNASAIEQIADKIILIHRPYTRIADKSSAAAADAKEKATIIVAKHRNGGLGDVAMRFRGERFSFEEV